jgi:UDP-4-amino-4-deoxy-L-arabinose formyltransferase/UDP-glucuronic acid dehydrogenase (UDP-4-keto-hexauronic acid decarboxylating)
VLGPINKQRWIYSARKQLLDRVIWAYGRRRTAVHAVPAVQLGRGAPPTASIPHASAARARSRSSSSISCRTPVTLVDGGEQKRCFTDVDDGIEAMFRIIQNRGGCCDGQIINIGNPDNEVSIRGLAELLVECFDRHPLRRHFPPFAGFRIAASSDYYGQGYEDVTHRRPSIRNARRLLQWEPKVLLAETIDKTLDFFLANAVADRDAPNVPGVETPVRATEAKGGLSSAQRLLSTDVAGICD